MVKAKRKNHYHRRFNVTSDRRRGCNLEGTWEKEVSTGISGILFLDLMVGQGDLSACPTNFRLTIPHNFIR